MGWGIGMEMQRGLPFLLACGMGLACSSGPEPSTVDPVFRRPKDDVQFDSAASLQDFDAGPDREYRIGPGDSIWIDVLGRDKLSGKQTVGPDGRITLPIVGTVRIEEQTRQKAAETVANSLARYYTEPVVTIRVDAYVSNRVIVLGRVTNPGLVHFETSPTLLEALSRAGALPILDKQATLTRCAVIRGRDRIAWIDLQRLLGEGDLSLNLRLIPNDLIYIPDSDDTLVYVMGYVEKPGAYRLTPDMTFLDALAQAGGPNEDAKTSSMVLARPRKGARILIDLENFTEGDARQDYKLEEGDIIYVPSSVIADVGYTFNKLSPLTGFIIFTQAMQGK